LAKIIPFRAIRPPRDVVHLVASRSYVSYDKASLCDKLENNPYTFLHIINPDWQGEELSGTDKYEAVRKAFDDFRAAGTFIQDSAPCIYLYEQIAHGESFMGLVVGAAVEDYRNGVIRKHEDTLSHRENMFKEYLKVTDFNAEPVLLTYPDALGIDELIAAKSEERPEYEYYTTDKHLHRLWVFEEARDLQHIQEYFSHMTALYIADGHHRSASSSLLADELHQELGTEGEQPFDYFMAFMIPESRMHIWDYNRLLRDLNGLSKEEFLEKLEGSFEVYRLSAGTDPRPRSKHHLSVYIGGEWFALTYHDESLDPTDPVADLDARILTVEVLRPILGIEDLRTSDRVDFLDGRKGMKGLEAAVDSGKYAAAFALYPVSTEQLKRISDADLTMPPKSTYIEPKLRSGLTVYPIEGKK